MNRLLFFAHILGFTLWLGGGLGGMAVGILGRREERSLQPVVVRLLFAIHRLVMAPGIILTLISGVYLSIPAAKMGMPSAWLMLMQVAGVIAGIMVGFISLPTLRRLSHMSPMGETATLYDALRKRQATAGMIAGSLGILALIGGVLVKH